MRDRIITVGGPPGTGKSTLCRILAARTGLRYVYVGALFRELAARRGMELVEFGRYAERHPEIDRELDRMAMKEARRGGLILEGRVAGALVRREGIPAFKVWVDADIGERARRVQARDGGVLGAVRCRMVEREEDEARRYLETYGLDIREPAIYDMVIDTTNLPPEAVADITLEAYARWLDYRHTTKKGRR